MASLNRNEIEQALLKIPALKHYKINNATGSLLVEYDATLIKPQLLEALFSRSDQEAKQACYALSAYLAL
ncbi:hypothetical protein C9I98_18220 [Photobacterium sanctipauli]|uniref:Uncharacterized protein n=1 Tax=Photobacterium sanctipauli TaxID=1342794 RepID=A0A2T3NPB7_9GAMM|nr:hypothetical protein C9I98_18220 [Photobacterium sanctipauli]